MKIKSKAYYVYILANQHKTVLYIGITNNLKRRLLEHKLRKNKKSFTARYQCYHLVYYEKFQNITIAIKREKELKGWKRAKKERLITSNNQSWVFINASADD